MPSPEKPVDEKTNPRRLLFNSEVYRVRVRHVIDVLFAGNFKHFSRAIRVMPRHVYFCVYKHQRVTPSLLAQIAAHTHVRAEWLLTGCGPMLREDVTTETISASVFPHTLHSSFPVLESLSLPGIKPPQPKKTRRRHSTSVAEAGHAVYMARVSGKPVCFFLGVDGIEGGGLKTLRTAFDADYASGAVLTLSTIRRMADYYEFDINAIAQLAATHGVGYGEALGRWAKIPFIQQATTARKPVTVHVEIGEIAEHLVPARHGALLGAAIGAAAYTDLLIFADQLLALLDGGVFVVLGEPHRALHLLYRTIHSLNAATVKTSKRFSVVLLGSEPTRDLVALIPSGGQLFSISGSYKKTAAALLDACAAAYTGK